MKQIDLNDLNKKMIEFILEFPFPYGDILREQVKTCSLVNKLYSDCYILLFEKHKSIKKLPMWLPPVPQGCQILKQNGPLSCQLFVEDGYVTQFEIVDMGMNPIDWDYFWSNTPLFDVNYNIEYIVCCLDKGDVTIKEALITHKDIIFMADTPTGPHTVCLWNCSIRSFHVPQNDYCFRLKIIYENHNFLLQSLDGNIDVRCSLLGLQDGLSIGQT